METITPEQHDDEERLADDVLVGGLNIKAFCVTVLGLPENTDPYWLKRRGWPIGNLHGSAGSLIASKRRLRRHVQKQIARGGSTAA